MNTNDNIKNKEKIAATFTATGACNFRKDFQGLKVIKKIQNQKEVIITKKIRAALFPLSIDKIKQIFGTENVGTLHDGTKRMLGKSVPVDIINEIFSKSAIFSRIAKMDYEKADESVILERLKKINIKETHLRRTRALKLAI